MIDAPESDNGPIAGRLRQLLLLILALGMIGTAADLMLLQHYEDAWQAPPLVLIASALVVLAILWVRSSWVMVTIMRVIMALFITSGAAGVLLHYNSNSEFQRELDPTLSGWPLAVKVLSAKAPPALAPGVMVQLGLLGLLFTYRHPSLVHPSRRRMLEHSSGAQK